MLAYCTLIEASSMQVIPAACTIEVAVLRTWEQDCNPRHRVLLHPRARSHGAPNADNAPNAVHPPLVVDGHPRVRVRNDLGGVFLAMVVLAPV